MNHNLDYGHSRKEKQIHLITKTTLVTVLIALGLALRAWAVEPPKPAAPPDLDKLVGQPVDLSSWAYAWREDYAGK